jgi:cytochrome c oxidase subunit IV
MDICVSAFLSGAVDWRENEMSERDRPVPDDGQLHVTGYGKLLLIIAALLALTGVTVAVSYVNLGFYNVPIALLIATAKSSLVLLFFMHLKYEGTAIKVSFLSTIAFLCIMISFTFWDVAFR